MKIIRTSSSNQDFVELCKALDSELHERYGKSQEQYHEYNIIEENNTVFIGYSGNSPIGCGCIKSIDGETVELKRMFVKKKFRKNGYGSRILSELEAWAKENYSTTALLETGKGQPEAIRAYKKHGYQLIDNYGPYVGIENSVCMRKYL